MKQIISLPNGNIVIGTQINCMQNDFCVDTLNSNQYRFMVKCIRQQVETDFCLIEATKNARFYTCGDFLAIFSDEAEFTINMKELNLLSAAAEKLESVDDNIITPSLLDQLIPDNLTITAIIHVLSTHVLAEDNSREVRELIDFLTNFIMMRNEKV